MEGRIQRYRGLADPWRTIRRNLIRPSEVPVKVIMSAWLAGTGKISTAANASRQDRIELFMFASPEKLARV
jgi:hypothetical protein